MYSYIKSFFVSEPVVEETKESSVEPEQPKRFYGWKKGIKYLNHPKCSFEVHPNLTNITSVDLRNLCPAIYDQGALGSCSANALGFAFHFCELKQTQPLPFIPSRLFLYYNERVIDGDPTQDTGAEIHDGVTSLNTTGVCPENEWDYNISQFTVKPPQNCYTDALNHRIIQYSAVNQDLTQIKQVLVDGYPVVFGFLVYESFQSEQVAKTGIVPMPQQDEKVVGGHAVAIVGYDDSKQVFIVRNSWGTGWGDQGYFYMPYAYVSNQDLATDFWVIKTITLSTNLQNVELEKVLEDKIENLNVSESETVDKKILSPKILNKKRKKGIISESIL